MANVPTPNNFNSILPAAPSGAVNVTFQADNNIPRNISAYVSAGTGQGGVNVVSAASYTLQQSDQGKLVIFTNNSAVSVSAPSTLPANFNTTVMFLGTAGGTVTPTSGTINNAASLSFSQGSGALIVFDGTNWWAELGGGGGGGSFTAGGDLSGSSTSQEVIGILSKAIDGSVPTDGQILQYSSTSGKWEMVVDRPIFPVSAVVGKPSAGQLVCIYTSASTMVFPANFSTPNSYGSVGANPTATATYTVYKNGSTVGTVQISTSGVFTFATSGGTSFTLSPGDRLTVVAPGSQDATLADVGITLVGTRTATVPAVLGQGIFLWRGTYNGSTTYNINDVVAYIVSGKVQTYICILGTTGNVPTNTTYWNLMAQAGADGTLSANQVQQEALVYADDTGSAANIYSITLSPAPSVIEGSLAVWKAAHTNTGPSTLAVNGVSGNIVIPGSSGETAALTANMIYASGTYFTVADGHGNWQLIGAGGGGDTTAKYVIGDYDTALANSIKNSIAYFGPDASPASRNTMDDEFDDTPNNSGTGNGLNARWSWLNQGSATIAYAASHATISCPSDGSAIHLRMIKQSLPGGTSWSFVTKMFAHLAANYGHGGVVLYEGSSSKGLTFGFGWNGGFQLEVYGTSFGNYRYTLAGGAWPMFPQGYFQLSRSGSTLTLSYSLNGVTFDQIYSAAVTADFTTAPDTIGLLVWPYSALSTFDYDFFRRTS